MMKLAYFMVGISALLAQPILAEDTLKKDDVTVLFTDVTFDGYNELKEKSFQVYSDSHGAHNLKKSNGKRKQGAWSVDELGRHCTEFNYIKCGKVVKMGDGVYHKYMNNIHTHTLKNFRKGNDM